MVSAISKVLVLLTAFSLISGCTWDQITPKVDCTTSPIEISVEEVLDSNCGEADGSFMLIPSGGTGPYTFTSDFDSRDDGIFTQLVAGSYTVTITDAVGCSVEETVSIANREGVNLDEVIASNTSCGSDVGSIEVAASGGVEPYTFSINGAEQESNLFSNLGTGSYNVVVTDAAGCETSQSVDILTNASYENSIKTIVETNCSISGCHDGSISPDLTTFNNIQSSANRIKARTANGSMPRGRTLTQTQIDLIACWVDDGALNN